MAKTKTVTKRAWRVFDRTGKLAQGELGRLFWISPVKEAAEGVGHKGETVRPVEIRWGVEE